MRKLGAAASVIALFWGLAGAPARADHGADTAGWIQQAGDLDGGSGPLVPGFRMQTVLFDAESFPRAEGVPRPGFKRYLAFGTVRVTNPDGTASARLVVSKSQDGLHWDPPQQAVIQEQNSPGEIPFVLDETESYFDVSYNRFLPAIGNAPIPSFSIYYRAKGEDRFNITSIQLAASEDAVTWQGQNCNVQTGRCPIAQNPAAPLVTGAASTGFKRGSNGPTDVIFQPIPAGGGGLCANGPAGPWGCRFVMLYSAIGNGGVETLGIASSGDGINWSGRNAPALGLGAAGSWDDDAVTQGHVLRRSASDFVLTYAGAQAPRNGCVGGQTSCFSLGVATSANGITYTRVPPGPSTPRSFVESFGGVAPVSLMNPRLVDDRLSSGAAHERIYYVRAGGDGSQGMMLAHTAPAPGGGPSLRIASPADGFFNTTRPPLEIYATDTLGSSIGVELTSVRVTIDGAAVEGWGAERTIITAYFRDAIRIAGTPDLGLADGTHSMVVTMADRDGLASSIGSTFFVDTIPPMTTLTEAPESPKVITPLGSIGRFEGTTSAGSAAEHSPLRRILMSVTNPMGEVKTYPVEPNTIERLDDRNWTWFWVAPVKDAHTLLPGSYKVSALGGDAAGNVEAPSADNTVTILVI